MLRSSWLQVLGVFIVAWHITPMDARPDDKSDCDKPVHYADHSEREAIPIGCPRGKRLGKAWDPATLNVTFHFFDKVNQKQPSYVLPWNHSFTNGNSRGSGGNGRSQPGNGEKKRLLVLIHGFTQGPNSTWLPGIRNAYLNLMGPNKVDVIVVDWQYGASGGPSRVVTAYSQAAANVQSVGRLTANFLARLMASRGIDEKSLHLFGHSLGGQTVGEAAHWLNTKHHIKPGRVSAMDPAEVLFKDEDNLLNRNDTYFMEVVHVTASPIVIATVIGEVGLFKAVGHVDMYPNGGKVLQPGCKVTSGFFCSHNKGVLYYQWMLEAAKNNCAVKGTLCNEENQAYKQSCESGRIEDVWQHVNSIARQRLSRDIQNNAPSEIIYFETESDKLGATCGAQRSRRSQGRLLKMRI